ncbi:MAG: ABC transporter ATP-binding protein [Lachnospiraceae bacterium]|nr:ABC transporter ATP-binding protein [Lachnospiraceae bacterium]
MSGYIIETKNLSKQYKDTYALSDATISIEKGKIYGLVGENGAGKTTLIKLLAGLIKRTSGELLFDGESSEEALRRNRRKCGFIVETPYLIPEMSAYENLNLQRIQRGIKNKSRILDVLNIVSLENNSKKVENYSLGMKQRLGIAIALLEEIEVLVLDEPTNGLDPQGIIEFRNLIIELKEKLGITIVISTHILSELEQIATDLIFVSHGKVVKEISMEEIRRYCEKRYVIRVSNTEKIKSLMEKNHRDVVIENETLYVYGDNSEYELARMIYESGCYTYEFREDMQTLEQYYLSVVGGRYE